MEKENAEKMIEILKKAFDGVATFNAKVIDIEADSLDEALKKIKIEMISSMKKKNKQDNSEIIQYEEKLNEAFFTELDDILKSYVSHVIIGKLIQEYKK